MPPSPPRSPRKGRRSPCFPYAGHSLRAGLATADRAAGVSERAILGQAGNRSTEVLRRSIREGSLFRENAVGEVGLEGMTEPGIREREDRTRELERRLANNDRSGG